MRIVVVLVLLAALAGASAASPAPAYVYDCPPGTTTQRGDGPCIGVLQSPTESLTEPYLASDPARPGVLVVGTNASQNVNALAPDRADEGVRTQLLGVHVSQDGGATWQRRQIPPVPFGNATQSISQWDPSFAFGPDGTLHVTGIEIHGATSLTGATVGVFYTSSPDLGLTWTEPVILGSGDRQWLSVEPDGHVFVAWWTTTLPFTAQVATSLDGGATWQVSGLEGCQFPSPVVRWDDAFLTACVGVDADGAPTGTRILRVDGGLSEVASFPALPGLFPVLEPLADGSLFLAVSQQACPQGAGRIMATRTSDGTTWTDPVDLLAQASVDEAMTIPRLYWIDSDPWGTVQMLVSGAFAHPGQPGAPNPDNCFAWFAVSAYGDEISTAHLVVDPSTLSVVHERSLTPRMAGGNRVPPAGYGLSRWGDFFGIARVGDRVMLVWEYERGLDYTLVDRA